MRSPASSARPPAATTGPGRRARKKERTRREIYAAAMRCFAADGYGQVPIDQICEAADVARATFFLHFPTKAALLHEFGRVVAAELRAELAEPGRAAASATARLEHVTDFIAARLLADGAVLGAMIVEFLATPQSPLSTLDSGRDLHALVEEVVRDGQARGEFDASLSPRLATGAFLATAASIVSSTLVDPTELSLDEVRRQFFQLVFRGLSRGFFRDFSSPDA